MPAFRLRPRQFAQRREFAYTHAPHEIVPDKEPPVLDHQIEQDLRDATQLEQLRQFAEAERLCNRILARQSEHAAALRLLGAIHYQTGRFATAATLLQRALALDPTNAVTHYDLALTFQYQGRHAEAIPLYRRALELKPAYPFAWNNLAIALRRSGQIDEAIAAYREAIRLDPSYADAHNNLGNVLKIQGQYTEAADAYRRALQLRPHYPEAHYNLGVILIETGDFSEAVESLQRAHALNPGHANTLQNLGFALKELGRTEEALQNLRRVAILNPANVETPFMIAMLEGHTPPAPPAGYVAGIFDAHADRFDRHLVEDLHYQAPQNLLAAVQRTLASPAARIQPPMVIVDAGCGTGLAAPLFAPLASRLIGVDISSRMIEHANRRGLYHELVVGDLVVDLSHRLDAIDLLLAVDVLNYLGDLAPLFTAAARALRSGALFAFTIESDCATGYVLRSTCRYAHAPAYLRELAARFGLRELLAETIVIRQEKNEPVPGQLLILQK